MGRERAYRAALFGVFTVGVAAFAVACVQALGITDGLPLVDAGDASPVGRDGGPGDGGGRDVTVPHDAARESGREAAPADAGHDACTTLSGFCTNRCGDTVDNCDRPIKCGGCTNDASCVANACGCVADPEAKTCAGRSCGSATNNCGQSVPCGSAGTTACQSKTDVCLASDTCCTPDNVTPCAGRCGGTVTNNCGQMITCAATNCGDGGVCLASNSCCTPDPEWCVNRCSTSTNDCDQMVNCGGCDGGLTCASGSCGCVPESVATACAGAVCGSVKNNCGQTVECGVAGTANCSSASAVCVAGACCEPASLSATCGTACNTTKTNNCGQTVSCGACGAGVCQSNVCCVDNGQACAGLQCGSATNNCGQTVQCADTCAAATPCNTGGAGANSCCVDNGMACNNATCGTATNNCGQTVSCGACQATQSCVAGACCSNVGVTCAVPTDCCTGNCDPTMLVCM